LENIISIDPSLSSTAVVISNDNKHRYISFYKDFKETNKWCKSLLPFVEFYSIKFTTLNNFSENELLKFKQYDELSLLIVSKIKKYLNNSLVKIESYSQQSKNGKFQDLIIFGTLLRYHILKYTNNIKLYPPKEVKKSIAKHVYGVDEKGISRNYEKKAGGNFNKWDMFYTLVHLNDSSKICEYCKENINDITKNKNVPKPLEDLIDAYLLNLV